MGDELQEVAAVATIPHGVLLCLTYDPGWEKREGLPPLSRLSIEEAADSHSNYYYSGPLGVLKAPNGAHLPFNLCPQLFIKVNSLHAF